MIPAKGSSHIKSRFIFIVIAILVLAYATVRFVLSRPGKLELGPDTTIITSPLNSDGTPDYVAALDAQESMGMTPDNNAAVPIIEAFGPDILEANTRQAVLDRLGLRLEERDPDQYFVSWTDWIQSHGIDADADSETRISLGDIQDDIQRGKLHQDLEPWLARNAHALDLFREASRRKRCYWPLIADSDPSYLFPTAFSVPTSLRPAGDALAVRAMLHNMRNEIDAS